MRPECEADPELPSSAEVKNDGTVPPIPHTSSGGSARSIKYRDIVTFYKILQLRSNQTSDLLFPGGERIVILVVVMEMKEENELGSRRLCRDHEIPEYE
jgi:hypothetical protein